MSIIINDDDVCPKCGAYWCGNGFCCNGHPKPRAIMPTECIICPETDKQKCFECFKEKVEKGEIKVVQ